MARRSSTATKSKTTKPRAKAGTKVAAKSAKDNAMMEVSYGHVITYVFLGTIIGLAIGALALLAVMSDLKSDQQAASQQIQARILQQTR